METITALRDRWQPVSEKIRSAGLPVRRYGEANVSKTTLNSWISGAENYFAKTDKLRKKRIRVKQYLWPKLLQKLRKYKLNLDIGDVSVVKKKVGTTTIKDDIVQKSIMFTRFAKINLKTEDQKPWRDFTKTFKDRQGTEEIDDIQEIFGFLDSIDADVYQIFKVNIDKMKELLSYMYDQRLIKENENWEEVIQPLPTISGKKIFEYDEEMSKKHDNYIVDIISGVNRRGFTVLKVPEAMMNILTEDVLGFATTFVRNNGVNIFATAGTSIQIYSNTRCMVDCSHLFKENLLAIARKDKTLTRLDMSSLNSLIQFLEQFSEFLSQQPFYTHNGLTVEDIGYSILASFGCTTMKDLMQNLHRDYGKKRKCVCTQTCSTN